ncbi:glycosyltransferase [Janibacter indicus]|uniref:glycosyltransferase n=1 Tax=Janibacter indicus TaxID=857417 RepID=UPI003D9A27C5
MTGTTDRPVIAHVSSAHRASDVRIHLREAATAVAAGFEVYLVANAHEVDLPDTGVVVHGLPPQRGRVRRMTLGSLRAIWATLKIRPDIVHMHDPELIWAILPLRALRKRVIYDAHEDLPSQALGKDYLGVRATKLAVLVARLLIRMAGKADRVVAATETIAKTFPSRKVVLVRNYPLVRSGPAYDPILSRPLAVAYLGVMGASRGTGAMIDSFAQHEFPQGWKAIIAGPEPEAQYWQDLTNRPGWARAVDYRGFMSTDAARDLLNECRVGIVTLKRTPAYLDSLPTKMFEYFAAGMPAIASDFPLWRQIIEHYDCGLLVDETRPDAIAAAVARYASDPELLVRHSENALRASRDHLNWTGEGERLIATYAQLV